LTYHTAIGRTPFEAFRKRCYTRLIVQEDDDYLDSEDVTRMAPNFSDFELFDESKNNQKLYFLDQSIFNFTSDYLSRSNSSKQVHLRKSRIQVGDDVLLKKNFDTNKNTRKGKFDTFYESISFQVIELLEEQRVLIKNSNGQKTVKETLLKKIG